jgi:hypothetical protein
LGQWYDDAYGYRKLITVDNTKVSTVNGTTLSDFPVLISTTDADWKSTANSGNVERSDGGDFVFTAANGTTLLDSEIESYDSVTGQLTAWVRVPTLEGARDTRIYVYYGNAAASAPGSGVGTWDSSYAGVWHLNDALESSLEFDTSSGDAPIMVAVSGDVYAVAYVGPDDDGYVKTLAVEPNGRVGAVIDTLEFETGDCAGPDMIRVASDVYAIAYAGASNDGFLKTVSISADGTVGAVLDTLEYDTGNGQDPHIVHVSGDIYAIAYTGFSARGDLTTVNITSAGVIGGVQDSAEFDIAAGAEPFLLPVSGNIYAVAYSGLGSDGWLKTIDISTDGTIGIEHDSFEFDTTNAESVSMVHVNGQIYAIAYQGPDDDGWLKTLSIGADGAIGSVKDSLEFDTAEATAPVIQDVKGTAHAIAYQDGSGDGQVVTVDVANNGTIGDAVIDRLEFDTLDASNCDVWLVDGDTIVIVYSGASTHGWLVSVHVDRGDLLSTGVVHDSSTNARDGTPSGNMNVAGLVTAKVGNGLTFDGANDFVNVGDFLSGAGTASYEAWVYKTDQDDVHVISKSDGITAAGTDHKFTLRLDDGATSRVNGRLNTVDNVGVDRQSADTFALNTWTHVAMVYDGSAVKMFINGALSTCEDAGNGGAGNTCNPTAALIASSRDVVIGNNDPGLNDRYFGGILDEVRASATARSADWIATAYTNQNDPPSFYGVGAEQTEVPALTVGPSSSGACGGSDCGYQTLQAAIDAAAAGSTIIVYRRTDDANNNECYDEHISIAKSLTLQGAATGGATAACIGTSSGGDIVTITASDVTLMNLHITGKSNNGAGGTNSKGNGGRASGHGVHVTGNDVDNVQIINCSLDFAYSDNIRFDGDQDSDGNGYIQVKQCYLHHADNGRNIRIIGGGGSSSDRHIVRNCLIHTGQGLMVSGAVDYATIDRNVIKGWPYYDHLDNAGFNAFPKLRSAGFGGGWLYYSNCIAGVWVTSGTPTDLTISNNLIIGARHGIRVNTSGTLENNTVVNPFNCNAYDYDGTIDATAIRDNTYGIMIADGFSGTIRNNIVSVTAENRANGDPGQASGTYYTPGITGYGLAFDGNSGTLNSATVTSNTIFGFLDTDGKTELNFGAGINPDSTNLSVDPLFASDNEDETNGGVGPCLSDGNQAGDTRCYEMYEDNFFPSSKGGSCHAQIVTNVAGAPDFVDLSGGGTRDADSHAVSAIGDCANTPDPATSPIIDFGSGSVGDEGGKSGGAPNVGAFGGTERASESGTLLISKITVGRGGTKAGTVDASGPGVIQPGSLGLTKVKIFFNRSVVMSSSSVQVRNYCDTQDVAIEKLGIAKVSTSPFKAVIHFEDSTVMNQAVRIKIFGDGPDRVVDSSSLEALDGEISDAVSGTLPSGNGTAGGDVEFVVFSLVGDIDGDGAVEGGVGGDDYAAIVKYPGYPSGDCSGGRSVSHNNDDRFSGTNAIDFDEAPDVKSCPEDLDGDGDVDSADLAIVTSNDGNTVSLPTCFEVRVAGDEDDAAERSNGNMALTNTDLALVDDPTVGMRFANITVPSGATITNAFIQFQVDASSTGPASLTLRGEDVDNAVTFSSSKNDITGRTTTTASEAWSPANWNTVGAAGTDQRTSDLTSIVQEIVDRGGWSSGNAMVFIVTGSGERLAVAHDGDSSAAPLLHVEYSP